jgi:hypothetical protein
MTYQRRPFRDPRKHPGGSGKAEGFADGGWTNQGKLRLPLPPAMTALLRLHYRQGKATRQAIIYAVTDIRAVQATNRSKAACSAWAAADIDRQDEDPVEHQTDSSVIPVGHNTVRHIPLPYTRCRLRRFKGLRSRGVFG